MFLTLRNGSFRTRGNRLIKRNDHPTMFWINFAALAFVNMLGLAFIIWAWRIAE
jgi:hypothetical protein